jgi:hypothetical protein
MGSLAAPLIGLGSSLVGGLLGRKKAQTTTQTGSSTPFFTPGQTELQDVLSRVLRKGIRNAGVVTQDEKNQAHTGVNNNFDALMQRLQSNAVGRGFGDSGKFNGDRTNLEINRANSMTDADFALKQQGTQRQLAMLGLASQNAYSTPGYHTEGTGTAPGQSWGQAIGGAISGAGSDIASQLYLDQLFKKYNSQSSTLPGRAGPTIGDILKMLPNGDIPHP